MKSIRICAALCAIFILPLHGISPRDAAKRVTDVKDFIKKDPFNDSQIQTEIHKVALPKKEVDDLNAFWTQLKKTTKPKVTPAPAPAKTPTPTPTTPTTPSTIESGSKDISGSLATGGVKASESGDTKSGKTGSTEQTKATDTSISSGSKPALQKIPSTR